MVLLLLRMNSVVIQWSSTGTSALYFSSRMVDVC